jgi:DNA-binding HxlR family transcriptional regulator
MKEKKNNRETFQGKYSYDNLTRVIHEKARLGIITSLLANKNGLSFNELKILCNLSDGNLSRHMQTLSEYKIIKVIKSFVSKKPKTTYKITKEGEQKFLSYLSELEKVIYDVHNVMKRDAKNLNVNNLNIKSV